MARFTTKTFVTASVPATSSLNHNEVLTSQPNFINILKIKVVPSIVGGTTEAQIYEKDTFLTADLLWGTNPFTATGFDPIQKDSAGVITEILRGFIVPYEDLDGTGELHIKLINNDSQAKTYTITVIYEVIRIADDVNTETLSADKTIAASDPLTHFLDPDGVNRNVDLMPEISGLRVVIVNIADAGPEDLIVREDSGTTTIVTVSQNEMAFLVCNGTVWKGMVGANT